ncbi:CCD42 protein, partial [Atractosteus spatula]|nr:CCD42 protein [Atractosteus spatula]
MKRQRAVRKAAQERELASRKQTDLCALREEMAALRQERDRLERRVQRNACYPRYLERVVQGSDQVRADPVVETSLWRPRGWERGRCFCCLEREGFTGLLDYSVTVSLHPSYLAILAMLLCPVCSDCALKCPHQC